MGWGWWGGGVEVEQQEGDTVVPKKYPGCGVLLGSDHTARKEMNSKGKKKNIFFFNCKWRLPGTLLLLPELQEPSTPTSAFPWKPELSQLW